MTPAAVMLAAVPAPMWFTMPVWLTMPMLFIMRRAAWVGPHLAD